MPKSIQYYVSRGYEMQTGMPLPNSMGEFDTGVILLDDLLDKSEKRNGKPSHHLEHGINNTILQGVSKMIASQQHLYNLCTNTTPEYTLKAQQTLTSLSLDILTGEEMDTNIQTIGEYFQMITLFTGNHIAKGIEMGLNIANQDITKPQFEACQCAGRIRQMVDDFEDYFDTHHKPFGDFLQQKNRLPELLFDGDRTQVVRLIENSDYEDAKKMVLNKNTREIMFNYCESEYKQILTLHPGAREFVIDFESIIS